MPITSTMIALVSAPTAVPTNDVTLPIDPSSCLPISVAPPLALSSRWFALTKVRPRSTCAITTVRSDSACAVSSDPASITTQARNAITPRQTMSSRHPLAIGSTRPSSRVPPSSIAANTTPPKISNNGCARTTRRATAHTSPTQTVARFNS